MEFWGDSIPVTDTKAGERLNLGVLADPILVGRERELEELQFYLTQRLKEKETPFLFPAKQKQERQS